MRVFGTLRIPAMINHKYVRVAPESDLRKLFDYSIPSHLEGKIEVGHCLKVPWGNKQIRAYALEFPEVPQVEKCRDVLDLAGTEPLVPESLCKLAQWLADYYCCDLAQSFRQMLPTLIRERENADKMALWVSVPEHLTETGVAEVLARRATAQLRAWKIVREMGGGWLAELVERCRTTAGTFRALEDRGFVAITQEKVERSPFQHQAVETQPLLLNQHQQEALRVILTAVTERDAKPFLLQGVTGSGKTEVYLQALQSVLDLGRTALILVPEISLTPQTVEHFRARFEGRQVRVAVLHSNLSDGERHDQWRQVQEGRARVVIGARSAVFAPLRDLGLIIVDEEHETSYKQETAPHYHARDVAVMRARIEKVPVVLGSATPSLESALNARLGKYRLLVLPERVDTACMPRIHIVDMRREKPETKGRILISQPLRQAVRARMVHGQQSILFLNRRGYATTVQCPSCGHVEECPHCSVPMVFHKTSGSLKCHFCGNEAHVPETCPECHFENYKYSGMGTQRIEDAVAQEFPQARWMRMDSDSMKGKGAYERALKEFGEGKLDLLVGTQMIAKGLHFPNVTCVGVIHTDSALNLPDFRAAERVFQQLVQVAGRAGRGEVAGEVYVQTYNPSHPSIQFARHHDVGGFIDQELEYRKAYHYPPYCRAALVTFRGRNEEKVRFCCDQAAKMLKGCALPETDFSDPAPAPIARVQDHYRFHLFIRARQIMPLSRALKTHVLATTWPEDIRVTVDIDPYHLL